METTEEYVRVPSVTREYREVFKDFSSLLEILVEKNFLSREECIEALKELKTGRCPNSDLMEKIKISTRKYRSFCFKDKNV